MPPKETIEFVEATFQELCKSIKHSEWESRFSVYLKTALDNRGIEAYYTGWKYGFYYLYLKNEGKQLILQPNHPNPTAIYIYLHNMAWNENGSLDIEPETLITGVTYQDEHYFFVPLEGNHAGERLKVYYPWAIGVYSEENLKAIQAFKAQKEVCDKEQKLRKELYEAIQTMS